MKRYRVGGFVRDTLLGLEPKDVDYVVVGSSPEEMIDLGFKEVGAHFPVFLHPDTQDEYALARFEQSTGDGHRDFSFRWKGVTLEQDLGRRDLTINAMAMDDDGKIIDPLGGQADLKSKTLRHAGEAFVEDPLRVLRVARFAARYPAFTVAQETLDLMEQIVEKGMLQTLSAERVWAETEKALLSESPNRYFNILRYVGALEVLFPEVDALSGIPQRVDYHAEGDAYFHTMCVLEEACTLTKDLPPARQLRIRFAALVHDLGKAKTPKKYLWGMDNEMLGKHPGHEAPEVFSPLLDALCNRIRVPGYLRKFGATVTEAHQIIHKISQVSKKGLNRVYETIGGNRAIRMDDYLLSDIATACYADSLGRLILGPDRVPYQQRSYPQADYFVGAMMALQAVEAGPIILKHLEKGGQQTKALELVVEARRKAAQKYIDETAGGIDFPR
ncbi:tRNA nucleotidyltransferase (CCA-adding enzyme) [Pseudomonas nitritireducens]|uniref:tRNA nucleotidyltransferase (CCA-adding enzyme) n=1 Tax=Pseudomonas nitroreducens TaxID=46680 RepID=A0A7W7KNM5_PSENT|nr:polynucleotide adenylyltransferase [Pseudomonas nitritireducens]MBB4865443.1 tRNA nucleotidyltransferase (CCA-adding enzyme) [Pseudomonas nitritireducens]